MAYFQPSTLCCYFFSSWFGCLELNTFISWSKHMMMFLIECHAAACLWFYNPQIKTVIQSCCVDASVDDDDHALYGMGRRIECDHAFGSSVLCMLVSIAWLIDFPRINFRSNVAFIEFYFCYENKQINKWHNFKYAYGNAKHMEWIKWKPYHGSLNLKEHRFCE